MSVDYTILKDEIRAGQFEIDGDVFVRVVRCRDCKFCMSYWGADYCDFFSHVTNDPDGFCSWAVKRTEVDA